MKTDYHYISSPDYINSLTFKYIETYSFRRGPGYKNDLEKYSLLRTKKKLNTLTQVESDEFLKLTELLWSVQYLINENGEIQPSAIKTRTFELQEQFVTGLVNILQTKVNKVHGWMCAPIYRDAIVFYDKDKKITSCLNVCLSCEYMQLDKNSYVNADEKVYDLLRQIFINCGHEIEPKNVGSTRFL